MKNLIRHVISLTALLFCAGLLSAQEAPKPVDEAQAAKKKQAAIARASRADEILKARLAFTESRDYSPYGTDTREAMTSIDALFDKKEFGKVVETADAALKQDPFSIRLLMAKAAALRELKLADKADDVRNRWIAVADSILNNGDGKSFQTAFMVINVDEEYDVLNLLGLQVVKQSLVNHEGAQFDLLTVKQARGEEAETIVLYFNVDRPLKALHKQLSQGAGDKTATPGK